MKINTAAKKYLIGVALTVGVLLSAPASAATFSSCVGTGYNIADNVSGTSACTISDDFNHDFPENSPLVVNTSPGFFNITDWVFGGILGADTGFGGTGTSVDANSGAIGGTSGTWNISGAVESNWEDIMLVFKDGAGTTLVGYLVTELVTSGLWSSPFEEPPFSFPGASPKDVSHISVYYTECTANCSPPVGEVPLPAGILLLISALGGLGFLARFRQKLA